MQLESNQPVAGEPDDGWQTARPLIDTQIVELVLCRFTGDKTSVDGGCQARALNLHPDMDCRALFLNAATLSTGPASAGFPEPQDEVRVPFRSGEAIGTGHL